MSWVLITDVDLTVKHHTCLFHGSTRPPSGSIISYQAIHSVYLHSGGLCAPTGAVTPVAESLGVISRRRPSAYSVPASALFAIHQKAHIIRIKNRKGRIQLPEQGPVIVL